jgi:TIR domain
VTEGFISYAHEDRDVCLALCKQLAPVEKSYGISFWKDDRNHTGCHFDARIQAAINRAKAHLILVSANSLWSKFIMEEEIPAIVHKQTTDNDLVMLVVVDRCDWTRMAGSLTASPRDKKLQLVPIKDWHRRNHALDATREQVAHALGAHFVITPQPLAHWKKP